MIKGSKHTLETREKLSLRYTGRHLSDQHKLNVSLALRGKRGGSKNNAWRGGRVSDGHGYVKLWIPSNDPFHSMCTYKNYVLEHRYVMAKQVGRILESWEPVHHLNGIKNDNRPENLLLVDPNIHDFVTKMQMRIRELETEIERLKE